MIEMKTIMLIVAGLLLGYFVTLSYLQYREIEGNKEPIHVPAAPNLTSV
jgi:hypothetical protein